MQPFAPPRFFEILENVNLKRTMRFLEFQELLKSVGYQQIYVIVEVIQFRDGSPNPKTFGG